MFAYSRYSALVLVGVCLHSLGVSLSSLTLMCVCGGAFVLVGVHVLGRHVCLVVICVCHVLCPLPLQGGRVMDSVMVVKDKHGPEAWL